MKLLSWLTNRVILGVVVILVVIWVYQFKLKPQYRPHYEQGIALYNASEYDNARRSLERAYEIAPNAVDVILMLGWTNFKLGNYEVARFYFDRVLKIEPDTEEAQIGAAFVAMETGAGDIDSRLVEKALAKSGGGDPNLRILAAAALSSRGDHFRAAQIYQELENDSSYGTAAKAALADMFGLQGFNDKPSRELPVLNKPSSLQVRFRASEGRMWRQAGSDWQPYYAAGVNLSTGVPGQYGSHNDGGVYQSWLQQARTLNANVVHVYTLLPPAFYRAFYHDARTSGKLLLYQHIWVSDPPQLDYYNTEFVEAMKHKIRDTIDSIHGRGMVPRRRRQTGGVYETDISAHVGGLLIGGDLDPDAVLQTNVVNAGKTSYSGKYISLSNGTAAEVWVAEMLDYMVQYETETYNEQRPVALSSWAPLDPLTHPSENPGTKNDIVSLDETKLRASGEFRAGLFSAYSVYPYYPDFLLNQSKYLTARDSQGPNPFFGYISELRARTPYPLVIVEYGIPNSLGISRFHPLGWHQGGHSEQQQADILTRLTRSIREAGCAGGLVFEMFDEWQKSNWLTRDYQIPAERSTLWLNDMNPEQRYGLIGFRPSGWRLFAGYEADWSDKRVLFEGGSGSDPAQNVRKVQIASDEGFLYLRMQLRCADCSLDGQQLPPDQATPLAYAIALNTLPGHAGIRNLPFGNAAVESGANFVLYLDRPANSQLLIASNYYPHEITPKPDSPEKSEFRLRRTFTPALEDSGAFVQMQVETRAPRYGTNGVFYPGQRYSRSVMRFGNGDPNAPEYDSAAEWYIDRKANTILVRVSWGKLLMTDPSAMSAFYGYSDKLEPLSQGSPGIEVAVFTLQKTGVPDSYEDDVVLAAMPQLNQGRVQNPARYSWKLWNTVSPQPYNKKAYYALQKEFADQTRSGSQPAAGAPRTGPAGNARRAGR